MMEIALAWLPWVGGVLIAIAIGAWFEGSKSYAIWLGYGGAVIAALAFAIHLQKIVWEQDKAIVTRTNLTMGFGAVLLNSPSPGQVTAWIRIKNSGPTTAYKVKGWQKLDGSKNLANLLHF
jgi:hypothetical protein